MPTPRNRVINGSVVDTWGHAVPHINEAGGGMVIPSQFLGVEHEVEGYRGAQEDLLLRGWRQMHDGSLREGTEFVFDGGAPGGTALKRLNAFEEIASRMNWRDSFRTSTHVHIGFTNLGGYDDGLPGDSLHRAQSFLKAYYLLEDVFYGYAGGDRANSGYCDPFERSMADFIKIVSAKTLEEFMNAVNQSTRYYGCNPKALEKHGTIEFRHMPLTISVVRLSAWINLILRMKKWVYERDQIEVFSDHVRAAGYDGFVLPILGELTDSLREFIPEKELRRRIGVLQAIEDPGRLPNRALTVTRLREMQANPLVQRFTEAYNGLPAVAPLLPPEEDDEEEDEYETDMQGHDQGVRTTSSPAELDDDGDPVIRAVAPRSTASGRIRPLTATWSTFDAPVPARDPFSDYEDLRATVTAQVAQANHTLSEYIDAVQLRNPTTEGGV